MAPFFRYRFRFCKRGTVRFISHRELMGVFARAFRRAELPLRMSLGFHPRPRFSLPAPLPVGAEGLDEVLELDLAEDLAPDDVARRLAPVLPQGIDIFRTERVDPPVRARIRSVRYRMLGPIEPDAVRRCAERPWLLVARRQGGTADIRPYLKAIEPCEGGCECEVLVTNEGTARPADIAETLCDGDARRARHLSLSRTAVNLDVPQEERL